MRIRLLSPENVFPVQTLWNDLSSVPMCRFV
jgi:hypothetical protein